MLAAILRASRASTASIHTHPLICLENDLLQYSLKYPTHSSSSHSSSRTLSLTSLAAESVHPDFCPLPQSLQKHIQLFFCGNPNKMNPAAYFLFLHHFHKEWCNRYKYNDNLPSFGVS